MSKSLRKTTDSPDQIRRELGEKIRQGAQAEYALGYLDIVNFDKYAEYFGNDQQQELISRMRGLLVKQKIDGNLLAVHPTAPGQFALLAKGTGAYLSITAELSATAYPKVNEKYSPRNGIDPQRVSCKAVVLTFGRNEEISDVVASAKELLFAPEIKDGGILIRAYSKESS